VVSALSYLHNDRGLLHLDIKDENVIVDQQFQVKLIDFGSVAPMPKNGWLFSTFYGTVEYCSPEVLSGNCYAGPELEMWTLGILLYVLIFNENPFYDVEETLKCQLQPPFSVSPLCLEVVKKLLAKQPQERMTLNELAKNEWVHQSIHIDMYRFKDVVHCSKYFIGL
jgi:PAS domain-containing serine/threonine kinase